MIYKFVNNKYKIKKILNNNAVISNDNLNHEVVILGNGIGHRHRVNDYVDSKEIIKVYYSGNNSSARKLLQMLDEIPFRIIETTEEIIRDAERILNVKLNENLLIALADHINFTVRRFKDGFEQPILVNEEIKRFYREEYDFGLYAVRKINSEYGINISQEEATSIAFHLVNAINSKSGSEIIKILEGVKDIVAIIVEHFDIKIDEESLDYSRLIIHLKFVMKKICYLNNGKKIEYSRELYENLIRDHEMVVVCLEQIGIYVNKNYKYILTAEDKLYLAIHIIKLLGYNT